MNISVKFDAKHPTEISGNFNDFAFNVAARNFESWLLNEKLSATEFSDRALDLLRIAGSIFAIDRAVKRQGKSRFFALNLPVRDIEFWSQPEVRSLVRDTIEAGSQDRWDLEFSVEKARRPAANRSGFTFHARPCVVCLYSGGLDSATGLANRLMDGDDREFLAIMARHESTQGTWAESQLNELKSRFKDRLSSTLVTAELKSPPLCRDPFQKGCRPRRFRDQENTQRGRSFLHMSLGGVAAIFAGASEVEIYESGIGAINLPLQHSVGWRSTRHGHPHYLKLMARLMGMIAERPIAYRLPFLESTKAEVVGRLTGHGLDDFIGKTFSCIHFPRPGQEHRQCGLCAGCLFRRSAIEAAGLASAEKPYRYDLFGEAESVNAIPGERLIFLKAILQQVSDLADIESGAEPPPWLTSHLFGTSIIEYETELAPYLEILSRYRQEWLALIQRIENQGYEWTKMLPASPAMVS